VRPASAAAIGATRGIAMNHAANATTTTAAEMTTARFRTQPEQ
jgi:hypothetical protein